MATGSTVNGKKRMTARMEYPTEGRGPLSRGKRRGGTLPALPGQKDFEALKAVYLCLLACSIGRL